MKVLNAEQTRLVDAYTIEHEPIAPIDLMERASMSFLEAFYQNHDPKNKIATVCGTGNNGGDGLAISRILISKGYTVQPYVVRVSNGGSDDFNVNLERLELLISVKIIKEVNDIPDFNNYLTIIDAMFGSGLTRPITGVYSEVIEAINKSQAKITAVDIPSGLFIDKPAEPGSIVKASTTISFQTPKLSFFIPENYQYVGNWKVVDIGLNQDYINQQETDYSTIEQFDVEKILPKRNKFAHKGSFGHGQLFGGSLGKMGAITLAAEAFIKAGAGLLTVTVPSSGINIMQISVPEAMVLEQPGEKYIESFNILQKANSFGIGPGLGQEKMTINAFGEFLRNNKIPLVLDADALNILSENRELLTVLPENTIITPHIKEFERLVGSCDNHWQRLAKAKEFSKDWHLIIVLKGAHTAIINSDGKIRYNTTGNPGMATGGTGDVLLGIITSLRAQGLSAIDAATAGTYIHGFAGDIAASKKSLTALVANDIIDALGKVFLSFSR